DKSEVLFMYSNGSGTFVYLLESSAAERAFASNDSEDNSGVVEEIEEEPEEIDMTDDVPWPADFMGDIPELEGKIVGLSKSDSYAGIELEYVEKEVFIDYIEKLKEIGFNVDAYDSMSGDYISFN